MAIGEWAHNFPVSKDAHPTYIDWPTVGYDIHFAIVIHEIFTALNAMQDALGYNIIGAFADLNTRLEQLDHATKAHGFYDRGDPASEDFTINDFQKDGNWHDLDLSGIIPLNTKLVLYKTRLRSPNPGDRIRYRTKGNTNEINVCSCEALRANITRHRMGMVTPNAARVIQYNADNVAWAELGWVGRGWWIR